jgi:hypothetical protein
MELDSSIQHRTDYSQKGGFTMYTFDLQTLEVDALAFCVAPTPEAANAMLDTYAQAQNLGQARRFSFQIRATSRGKTNTMHLGYLAVPSGTPKAPGINVVAVAPAVYAHTILPQADLESLYDDSFRTALTDYLLSHQRAIDPSLVLGLIESVGDEAHVYIPSKVRS